MAETGRYHSQLWRLHGRQRVGIRAGFEGQHPSDT